jgi:glucan phosphoethanolaminetransferase (alkaline phosphatase superfamily)
METLPLTLALLPWVKFIIIAIVILVITVVLIVLIVWTNVKLRRSWMDRVKDFFGDLFFVLVMLKEKVGIFFTEPDNYDQDDQVIKR